ncbi:hypothetical protein [Desulfobacterium sp. N47]|uniref:Uncharacterized protein n=1 Tax=uncultured Desulfobacterium sp. TaxID=201089 RepID=E1YD67_9BACT|nr:unknown protein [uncultured Desulfobacterium sp.]
MKSLGTEGVREVLESLPSPSGQNEVILFDKFFDTRKIEAIK